MSDETTLLLCPFCGGEADISDEGSGTEPERYWVFCANGRCFVEGTPAFATEAEAIAAWNARAELGRRTCEPKWTLQGSTQTQEFWRCECGNCGCEFGVEDRQSFPWHVIVGSVDVPNFCPECGTRQKAVKR